MAREMVGALVASKLSVAEFARAHDIPKQRIFYWRERIAELDKQEDRASSQPGGGGGFAPMRIKEVSDPEAPAERSLEATQTLEATLRSGARVVVHGAWHAEAMRMWISAIEGDRC